MNMEYPEVPDSIGEKNLCLDTDIAKAINDLRNILLS